MSGALSYEFALDFVTERARLLRPRPHHSGAMAVIAASDDEITAYIHDLGLGGRVVIAVYSGPAGQTVAGEKQAVEQLASRMKLDGFRMTILNVDQGKAHCVVRSASH